MLTCSHAPMHVWALLLLGLLLSSQAQAPVQNITGHSDARQALGTAGILDLFKAAPSQEHYSAICVIAKNENKYLREWLQYHRCLGIGKVYIYDHNSTIPMSHNITDFIEEGFVEYSPITGSHQKYKEGFSSNLERFMTTIQGQAYKDCVTRHSADHTFLGFIDVDEFLVFHDPAITSVNTFLRRYEKYGGVSLYWVLFGSSGHKEQPDDWVTRAYTKCLPYTHKYNTQFKSFVNTAFRPTMYSPHRAQFEVAGPTAFLVDENERRIASGRNKNCTHTYAAVYHYATKSKADFRAKLQRGGGAGVTRPSYYQRLLDQQCKNTCRAAQDTYARACAASRVKQLVQ